MARIRLVRETGNHSEVYISASSWRTWIDGPSTGLVGCAALVRVLPPTVPKFRLAFALHVRLYSQSLSHYSSCDRLAAFLVLLLRQSTNSPKYISVRWNHSAKVQEASRLVLDIGRRLTFELIR